MYPPYRCSLRSPHVHWEGCSSPLPNPPPNGTLIGNNSEAAPTTRERALKDGLQEGGDRSGSDHGRASAWEAKSAENHYGDD